VPETIWTLIGKVGHHHSLLLVMGNEACDADSLASSVALAYSASMNKLGDVTPTGAIIAPVINIPRQDLALRQDIVYMLKEASINADDLLFYPEMPEVTCSPDFSSTACTHTVQNLVFPFKLVTSVISCHSIHLFITPSLPFSLSSPRPRNDSAACL